MSRLGKCHNYAGCLLAYRGEKVDVPAGQPFVCAECAKPLVSVKPSVAGVLRYLVPIVLLGALAGGGYFAWPKIQETLAKKPARAAAEPPSPTPEEIPTASPSFAAPKVTAAAEPPAAPIAPAKIDLDVSRTGNRQVREEVLKRIDLMPNVSRANKDKLYNSVERARQMGQVLTVPFGKGNTSLSPADSQLLKTELEKPALMNLRAEPTAVFVILGYADAKGDPKSNLAISQTRADAVVGTMKNTVGVANVIHAVAMGGSTFLDAKNLEKNRIAEVWVVLP